MSFLKNFSHPWVFYKTQQMSEQMAILLLCLPAWWINLYAGNLMLRLISLNTIQTLLYEHHPTAVLIRTTWKVFKWKLVCVISQKYAEVC